MTLYLNGKYKMSRGKSDIRCISIWIHICALTVRDTVRIKLLVSLSGNLLPYFSLLFTVFLLPFLAIILFFTKFTNQETVAWWGNFAFLPATKHEIQILSQRFYGAFHKKRGNFLLKSQYLDFTFIEMFPLASKV